MIARRSAVALGVALAAAAILIFAFEKPMGSPQAAPEASNKNPYLEEYSLPAGSGPNGLIVDRQGTVWVASSKSDLLYSLDGSGVLKNYKIGDGSHQYFRPGQNTSMVWTMVQDKDGMIWFSALGSGTIWRFDPSDHSFHALDSKAGAAFQMKADPQMGDVWFTTLEGNSLGVIQKDPASPYGYTISSFDLGNGTGPAGLYLRGQSVWVTEITSQKVVKYSIGMKDGLVSGVQKIGEIPPDNQTQLSAPTDVVAGNDSLWLTEHETSFLTQYILGENQLVRYPTSQSPYHATTLPFWIRPVEGGNYLWFNEHEGNKLALFDKGNKTMVEYDIPSRPKDGYLTYPLNIATDPRDNMVLWFSEWNTDKIGRIDGHTKIPFSISASTKTVVLNPDASKPAEVDLKVNGTSPFSGNVVNLNASSSMELAAGFGSVDVSIEPGSIDLDSNHDAKLFLTNYSAPPGNYTLGVSVSNGAVTKTIFLGLVIPRG